MEAVVGAGQRACDVMKKEFEVKAASRGVALKLRWKISDNSEPTWHDAAAETFDNIYPHDDHTHPHLLHKFISYGHEKKFTTSSGNCEEIRLIN